MQKRKFLLATLGCKVNQFETESIGVALSQAGWTKTIKYNEADLCIINTCTVTGKASMQSRQAIRNIIRKCPHAHIVVTGCYAQSEADEILKIEGVSRIVGNVEKYLIPQMVKDIKLSDTPLFPVVSPDCNKSCNDRTFRSLDVNVHGGRTRPFLKIQDGCNAFCSYCIVPHTRGRSRSMDMDTVLHRLHELGRVGYKEVVLTGIHIGAWGLDSGSATFYDLLSRINDERPVSRIRISSIEPKEITEKILTLFKESDVFCRHLHIPFQSGDTGILKAMNRPYDSLYLSDLVMSVKQLMPGTSIGADILAGFPGETDVEFNNTVDLIESLPLSYLHVFPFSSRKRTPASSFPDHVPQDILKQRTEHLRNIGASKKKEFLQSLTGQELTVLIEARRDRKTGLLKGLTSNYATVTVDGPDSLYNTLVTAVSEKTDGSVIHGRLV